MGSIPVVFIQSDDEVEIRRNGASRRVWPILFTLCVYSNYTLTKESNYTQKGKYLSNKPPSQLTLFAQKSSVASYGKLDRLRLKNLAKKLWIG